MTLGAPGPGTAWALGCCLLLALATWLGSRTAGSAPPGTLAVAGGLLIAIVAFDLAPDALADGAQHDTPAVVLVATAGSAAVVLWWLLTSTSSGVGSSWRIRAAAGGLAAHRAVEGATLGLAAATDLRAGALVLVGLVLHGGCEGAVFKVTARDVHCPTRTTARWLAVLCAAPVPGLAWAALAGPSGLQAVATAAVCGLLLTTGSANLHRAAALLSRRRSAALGAAGAGLLALTLHLPT